MDNLDFGITDLDAHTHDAEVHRYDNIQDDQDKRKNIIYDIKTGRLSAKDYPQIFSQFAKILKMDYDGRFVWVIPPIEDKDEKEKKKKEEYYRGLRTKALTFAMTGKIRDASTSSATPEVKRIARGIATEVMRGISLDDKHFGRTLLAMYKKGEIQKKINDYIKVKHYDLLDKSWADETLSPMVMSLVPQIRKGEKAAARGDLAGAMREEVERVKNMIRKVYSE